MTKWYWSAYGESEYPAGIVATKRVALACHLDLLVLLGLVEVAVPESHCRDGRTGVAHREVQRQRLSRTERGWWSVRDGPRGRFGRDLGHDALNLLVGRLGPGQGRASQFHHGVEVVVESTEAGPTSSPEGTLGGSERQIVDVDARRSIDRIDPRDTRRAIRRQRVRQRGRLPDAESELVVDRGAHLPREEAAESLLDPDVDEEAPNLGGRRVVHLSVWNPLELLSRIRGQALEPSGDLKRASTGHCAAS